MNDSALARGIRTAIQAFAGFFIGLLTAVWTVPGVPDAVIAYMQTNSLGLALAVGIPSGVVAFVWNALRPGVKNF